MKTPMIMMMMNTANEVDTFRFSSHRQAGSNRNAVKMPITMGAMMLLAYTMKAMPAKHSITIHVILMSLSVLI